MRYIFLFALGVVYTLGCTEDRSNPSGEGQYYNVYNFYKGSIHYIVFTSGPSVHVVNYTADSLENTYMTDAFPNEENFNPNSDSTLKHGK